MTELERRAGALPSIRSVLNDRVVKRAEGSIQRDAAIAHRKIEGLASVTLHSMRCLARLDSFREATATNDVLNILLAQKEGEFQRITSHIESTMHSPWSW